MRFWPKSINLRAAIIGGIFLIFATILGVILTSIFVGNNTKIEIASPNSTIPQDSLSIVKVRPIIDQPTRIYESAVIFGKEVLNTGIITSYWEVQLANRGRDDLSIIDYDLIQLSEENIPIRYTYLKQGLYTLDESTLQPFRFPLLLKAGDVITLFVGVGVIVDTSAYRLIKESFNAHGITLLSDIQDFLRGNRMDIYGNRFNEVDKAGLSLGSLDGIKEQIFVISFKSSRDYKTGEFLSMYRYGLFRMVTEN